MAKEAKEAEKSKMEDLKKEVDMVCIDHCQLLYIFSSLSQLLLKCSKFQLLPKNVHKDTRSSLLRGIRLPPPISCYP